MLNNQKIKKHKKGLERTILNNLKEDRLKDI